ncbi:MAG: phage tail sheath C-terminal domain-containing protein [Candidatus Hodarchaeota archaeon]
MAEVITEMVLPGVYIEVRPEALISVGGIVTGRIGIVGTAARGPLNEVTTVSRYPQAQDIFGAYDAWRGGDSELTLVRALEQAFNNGASDIRAVRVGGAGVSRASAVLQDTTPADQIRIQARDPGDWANDGFVKVEMNVEKKVKRFTVQKTAPFNTDLDELQLENTNLVRKDGTDASLRPEDIEIRNLSTTPVKKYTLGPSPASRDHFLIDSEGRENGTIVFGAAQAEGDVLEAAYHIIRRIVVANEKKNVDESNEIELDRQPVDPDRMRVLVGTTLFKRGIATAEGIYTLSDKTLTFPSTVPEGTLVTVTYRYAPVSRVTMCLPTGEEEVYEVENARDLANMLDARADRDGTLFTYQIIANAENPMNIGELTLTGGNNGADASAAQYSDGLTLLENEEVNIVLAAGLGASQFTSALLGHVDSMESQGKDRIGLIGSHLGDDADAIKGHTEALSHRRMVLVAPGIKVIDAAGSKSQGRTVVVTLPGSYAAAAVAGKLASLAPHISPTNKVMSVRGLEHEFFRAEKKDLVQNRVLCLEKKTGFRIVRGISTDPGPFAQITTRRIVDKAKAGIRIGSLPFIGRLNNERVRKALKGALDGFLTSMVQDEALVSYELEVTATRPDEIAGRAIVTVVLRPTFSIDYIKVIMYLE